jgi:hypothetical protein
VGGLLFLTLPTGGEAGGLTKENEIFLKDKQQIIKSAAKASRKNSPATMTAAGAGTY